jgi:hypothetical protein
VEEWQGEGRRRYEIVGNPKCLCGTWIGLTGRFLFFFRLERMRSQIQQPTVTIPPIFHGLETPEDMIFWKHYNERLSTVLTVEGEYRNAFKDMMVPIAVKHHGLMHSILSLSSKHIDYDTPYGANLVKSNPGMTLEKLQQRSDFHHEKAVEKLYTDIAKEVDKSSPEYRDSLSARYGQMLCLLLESIAEGNPRGEHRVHLRAYQTMIQHTPPEDPAFLAFITEFFQYHIFADELIRLPDRRPSQVVDAPEWQPLSLGQAPRLLGVTDGLFHYLSQITSIRNTIRANMRAQFDPVVDYTSLYRAAEIDAAIREWSPRCPSGDSRERVGLLYKQMMWVYLFRTIYPPSSSSLPATTSLHDAATSYPPAFSSTMGVRGQASPARTPPHSNSPSCASSPRLTNPNQHANPAVSGNNARSRNYVYDGGRPSPRSNPPSRKNSGSDAPADFRWERKEEAEARQPHHGDANDDDGLQPLSLPSAACIRAESPAPIRYPPGHDSRITTAVEESLGILETLAPTDPSQKLLLIPCLVIGMACFAPSQRARVRVALTTVRGYTGLRNTDLVSRVLEEAWRLMDAGEWVSVWDWQTMAKGLGVDFLCA